MHFAGVRGMRESAQHPYVSYNYNIAGTISLFQAIEAEGVRRLAYSSSATVHGDSTSNSTRKDFARTAVNRCGQSALVKRVIAVGFHSFETPKNAP